MPTKKILKTLTIHLEKIITDPFIIRGIIAGIAVALVSGLVGCFVVWRRLSYYGESIAHSSLLGAGIGILLGIGINFGVVFVCIFCSYPHLCFLFVLSVCILCILPVGLIGFYSFAWGCSEIQQEAL